MMQRCRGDRWQLSVSWFGWSVPTHSTCSIWILPLPIWVGLGATASLHALSHHALYRALFTVVLLSNPLLRSSLARRLSSAVSFCRTTFEFIFFSASLDPSPPCCNVSCLVSCRALPGVRGLSCHHHSLVYYAFAATGFFFLSFKCCYHYHYNRHHHHHLRLRLLPHARFLYFFIVTFAVVPCWTNFLKKKSIPKQMKVTFI